MGDPGHLGGWVAPSRGLLGNVWMGGSIVVCWGACVMVALGAAALGVAALGAAVLGVAALGVAVLGVAAL